SLIIGDFEHDGENTGLCVIQVEETGQQQRTHFGNGGAHGVSLLTEHVPKYDGTRRKVQVSEFKLFRALKNARVLASGLTQTGKIAFHIRKKYRRPTLAETLGELLQCNGFTRARRPGNKPVAVGHSRKKIRVVAVLCHENRV